MVNADPGVEILEGMYGKQEVPQIAGSQKRSKEVMYWRKCKGCQIHTQELGWITLGPAMGVYTAQEYFDFQTSKHAEPLTKYGKYYAGKVGTSKYDVMTPEKRFEPLIEQNGFRELPLDQMIAYNWHRIPVLVKYVPQLEDVADFPCNFGCPPNKTFNSEASLNTHIRVWHNDVAQTQAVGKEMSKALEAVRESNTQTITPEFIAAIAVAVKEAMSLTPKED